MWENLCFMGKRSRCAIVCLNMNNSLLSRLRSLLHQRHGSSLPLSQLHDDPSSELNLKEKNKKKRDESRLCPSSTLHPTVLLHSSFLPPLIILLFCRSFSLLLCSLSFFFLPFAPSPRERKGSPPYLCAVTPTSQLNYGWALHCVLCHQPSLPSPSPLGCLCIVLIKTQPPVIDFNTIYIRDD